MAVTESRTSNCGFCGTKHHSKCAVGTKHRGRHEKHPNGVVWVCTCECNIGRRKCAHCGNRTTSEVDPATWECIDIEACQAKVATKRENDPFTHQLREIQESVKMAKVEENKAKAEKAEKVKEPTFCLVTGEPTKGGLFKPGMDARYVSQRVEAVVESGFTKKTEQEQRTKMKNDGVSERLVAKFDKSLGLARDKAEKRKADAEAKAAAKAEAQAEKASA